MLFQSWVGAEQHNIHHKQPIMPITMWQISSLCLSQVVQYQTIHTIILSYLKIFRNTIHLQTFKPSNTLQLLIWSLQNEGYVSIAPDFKTKRNTSWSLSRPTGTYLKVRTKWKWKPSLSLLNNHQIKIQTLFFFFFKPLIQKTTCIFPFSFCLNRNLLHPTLLSLSWGAASQTQQYFSNHFEDH